MDDLGTFLAHAVALEKESGERFDALADSLEVHHNPEVVELFRKMAHFSRLHLREVQDRAVGVVLPHLRPWEFSWPNAEAPETPSVEDTHYRMTAHHALLQALASERQGQAFYAGVAARTVNAQVKALATAFAAEEGEHVALLEATLSRFPPPPANWAEDPDPPNAPD
ncbi:ferritin-like domain-containing protein [Pararhodospirillum oryzae]|uniref:Rubrerythrin n=1 Tax=Pararhodospirillum oryzae TaxID=478448 RepID=A0A512H4I3_9PROT|nr:ferritin family protein [Pararhodospirillum oryzae]GEO80376.1 rubrerythrin [Pararhodospirillum oryzae]